MAQKRKINNIDKIQNKSDQNIDHQTKYDEAYLKELRDKAKKTWLGEINPDKWLKEIRGGYD
jgi:hypothetical protein